MRVYVDTSKNQWAVPCCFPIRSDMPIERRRKLEKKLLPDPSTQKVARSRAFVSIIPVLILRALDNMSAQQALSHHRRTTMAKKTEAGVGKRLGIDTADVARAVKAAGGNKVLAAAALGCSRSTVCYHMRKHDRLAKQKLKKGSK